MQKSKISIITVAYNETVQLGKLLSSIKKHNPELIERVIVVDNSDILVGQVSPLVKKFGAKYVSSGGNIGFGPACNKGVRLTDSEYILFLNPDVLVFDGTMKKLVSFMDKNPDFAGCSPQLVSEDGESFQQLGSMILTPSRALVVESFINKWFPKNPVSKGFYNLEDKGDYFVTKTLPGSAFLVRRSDFAKIGLFDEDLFMFFEEYDIGLRMDKVLRKFAILKGVSLMHGWKKLSGGKNLTPIFNRSRRIYFRKHFGIISMCVVETFLFLSPKRIALLAVFVSLLTLFI
jgi:GT2 family glycosyltransferase